MATIGRPIGVPGHTTQKLDAPDDLDTGTANSFTMKVGGVAVSPDEASLAVYVSNVRQIPGVAYTVSGSTLTFTGTVTTSNYSYAIIMGDAMYVENNSVDESKLKISNGPTNGQFLSAQSGDTGGLTWASVSSVGGATGVDFNDSIKTRFGTGNDLELYHDGSNSFIQQSGTGALKLATEDSGKAVSIGHTTSETTVNDNLTVTGDLSVTGAASGWQLVSAAVPSAATYLDISINTAARYHRIVLAGIKGSVNDKAFKVQVGYGETPTILVGTSYQFSEWSTSSAEASNMNGAGGVAEVPLTEFAVGNATGEGVLLLDLRLHTSNPTDDRIAAHWKQCSRFETGDAVNTTGVFTCDTGGNVINTVRFLWQTTCDFAAEGEAYYYTLLED